MQFKEQILNIRLKLKLSQEALAREVGVSYATINRWENGHSEPSLLKMSLLTDLCKQKGLEIGVIDEI